MEASPSPPPQSLGKTIIPESERTINSKPSHFLALSFLFLFLPSAATVAFLTFRYPLLHRAISDNLLSKTKLFKIASDRDQQDNTNHALWLALGLFVFNLVSSSCAVGSITYAVFHRLRRPQSHVSLGAAIGSLAASLLPLSATNLLLQAATFAVFATAFAAALLLAALLGFRNIDVYSLNFLLFSNFALLAIMFLVTYLQVDWSLALAITSVKPTTWGFESLKLSKTLISMNGKRARDSAFNMSYRFGVTHALILFVFCFNSILMGLDQADMSADTNGWNFLLFALAAQILAFSISLSSLQLRHIAFNTLLYVHCKASISSSDHEDEQYYGCEFPTEYVMVPVEDDEKEVLDQRVVSVV